MPLGGPFVWPETRTDSTRRDKLSALWALGTRGSLSQGAGLPHPNAGGGVGSHTAGFQSRPLYLRLCCLGQVTGSLCASVSSSVKWG